MVPSSLIPGKKLLIEITKAVLHLSLGKLLWKANQGKRNFESWEGDPDGRNWSKSLGAWEPSLLLQTHPLASSAFCSVTWAMTAHCSFSLLHFVLIYFHDYVMFVYLLTRDCMLPKDRDCMLCDCPAASQCTGLLHCRCWMCVPAVLHCDGDILILIHHCPDFSVSGVPHASVLK